MRQKDIGTIVAVIIVSGIFSYIIAGVLFGKTKTQQQVEVVSAISSNFQSPSTKYFNSQSIDPTQLIQISNNSNQTPFGTPPTN